MVIILKGSDRYCIIDFRVGIVISEIDGLSFYFYFSFIFIFHFPFILFWFSFLLLDLGKGV